ncbi:phage shock protein A (PspA) family protein [Gracilibacillus ureilyticus]|uniref:Phage shock protein A (PspA) family protein n=1 Tax=Gracilibacillus ureilyticus TaxID=531814 RepID=A0A1H9SX73_9BACI|nr:PspA/IM30 family protein [Gracilibacillus ureilyticus]SER89602.1 phage shock protein A (PspA) family protein [Gracilibacillus ureilyticus]
MTNLFTRIKDSVMADLHEIMDQKEEKNPIAHVNQYIRECEHEVNKIKHLVEKQYEIKYDVSRELAQARLMVEKRKKQLELATSMEEHDLASEAKSELDQFEARVNKLEVMESQSIKDLETLETKYVQMKQKLKDLYVKRLELKSRENIARTKRGMNKVLETELISKSASKFAELESYIERIEQRVHSEYRLHTLDARFADLEKKASNLN